MTKPSRTYLAFALAIGWVLGLSTPALAQGAMPGADSSPATRTGHSGLPLPRFVSLRAPKVNMRTGPGIGYPIDWVYTRAKLPLEVIDEYDTWRQVRDWEGSTGWIHQSMLSNRRTVMILDRQRPLRRRPKLGTPVVALVEANVIGRAERCEGDWCQIKVEGIEGWLRRDEVFGVYPDEKIR